MKIDRFNLYHLRMPLRTPFETSFGRINTRDCILLEAIAGDLVGYGECVADFSPGYSYETTKTARHILCDFLLPAVISREVESPQDLLMRLNFVRGHPMAKSGLEMAYWDLWGKQSGVSLSQLLHGVHRRVRVGVSVGIQETPQSLVSVINIYVQQGYKRIKIKIKPGRDVVDARAVRQAYHDLCLQVDANSAYSFETARELAPLDELGLLMIEQPLAEDDLWDHRALQELFQTPLCLDESILGLRHARQALEMNACRVINIKLGRVGGLSTAVAIHDFCYTRGVPVWCGGMLETGVGRAANLALASLPGFSLPGDISATDRYYEEDITEQRFVLNSDSTIDVPDGSGLGVTISSDALRRTTLEKVTVGVK